MDDDEILKIYNKGVEEGKKHKSPSPDTVRMNDANKVEIDGVASDLEAFRVGLIKLALGMMSVIAVYGIWVGTIQSAISSQKEESHEIKEKISEVEKKQQTTEGVVIEIKTKLSNIETTLAEIKVKLR